MIITPLGHTEFLLDINNASGQNVRILVDSWLSDFVVGDLMERTIGVTLDADKISSIDAIFISHSHTDHLDPYTLVEIYKYASPLLILPITLSYLEGVFKEFLPQAQIHFLVPKTPFYLKGIEINGYMFSQNDITNEDDVMMIAFSNEKELLFAEIDTVIDEYDEEVQSELFRIFDRQEYETRTYLSSRNELEGQLRIYDFDEKRRKSFRSQYISEKKEEMKSRYEKFEYDEYVDFPNIYTLPGFNRGFVGQGLKYPKFLSDSLSLISIFPLDEIASMEVDIARSFGYEFSQKALLPGRQYKLENGTIETGRKECPIGALSISNSNLGDATSRIFATKPLIPTNIINHNHIQSDCSRILTILNTRFIPYWSASPVASLRSALLKNPEGTYKIELKIANSDSILFEYSFGSTEFIQIPYIPNIRVDEEYWMEDVLDFLDGKQELYSNFWHTMDPKRIYRLWTCLGANFCNNSIVIKKYRLHFEKAIGGKTSSDWVIPILMNLR